MFDNPLRRTVPAMKQEAVEANDGVSPISPKAGLVIPIATTGTNEHPTRRLDPALQNANALPPRITVRIDDSIRCALETECHKRRLAGEKTNLADVARGILSDWASR